MSRRRCPIEIDPENMHFNDPKLQAAYEATKEVFAQARDAAAWKESDNRRQPMAPTEGAGTAGG